MSSTLTLHDVAAELGVHYMTVYRYVRQGLLEADKVGSSWQVHPEAVERFRNGEGTGPVERGSSAPWSKRIEDRLVVGDAAGAWSVVESAMASGADLDSVYIGVLSPALVSIGSRWASGELDVAVEHTASGITSRIIGRLGHRFVPRGVSRGHVIVGAVAGESHSLPTAMLSDLLRMRGWNVTDLGADVPAASFLYSIDNNSTVEVVGMSVTHTDNRASLAATCAVVRAQCPEMKIVAGGRAIESDERAHELGADARAVSGAEFNALLESWLVRN